MRKQRIVRYILTALLVIICSLALLALLGTVAHAAGLVDDTVDAANVYSKYPMENYQLDFYVDSSWDWLPWNWLEGVGKSIQYGLYAITNFIWTVSMYISNATGYVVQEAYKLDFISDTANAIGKNIQTLAGVSQSGFSSQGFYVGFLLILILVMGIYVAYTGLIKRETTKAVHAVLNFLVVFILSASFIAYAPNYITKINDFSSDVSNAALSLGTKIVLPNSDSEGKDSVDLIRDSLFAIQVQQPWLLLQYGNSDIDKLGADRVEKLLSASPDTDSREDIVVDEIEKQDNLNMSITKTMSRLGTVVFLFIFNIGISIFVFLLTGMMIFSQVLFIIYAMFLPISFVLSMIPTYESIGKRALEKLFNTIMLRAGITLIITAAFSVSTMFYSISQGYPFFMIAFLQIVTFAGIYFKLGDLMAMFSLQSGDTQQIGRRIMRRPYMFLNRGARRLERRIGKTAAAGAAGGAIGATLFSKKQRANKSRTGNHTWTDNSTSTNQAQVVESKNLGKRAGAKVGAILDTKDRVKDKAQSVKQQVKDIPTQARYAVHSGVNQIQENVSDFKRGIVEEQSTRKQGRIDRQNQQRQTIAEKRMALDKAKQTSGLAPKASSPTKGVAPAHERPVTNPVTVARTSPVIATKQEPVIKERPVTASPTTTESRQRKESVSTLPVTRKTDTTSASTSTSRQTVERQNQTRQIKQTSQKATTKKTTYRKGRKQ